jgi:hypothetical protein
VEIFSNLSNVCNEKFQKQITKYQPKGGKVIFGSPLKLWNDSVL